MSTELLPDMAIGPHAYARSIAYMSCPSTIRHTTLRMFGRAPSIEQCTVYREAYKRAKLIPERRIRESDMLGDTFQCGHPREMDNITFRGNEEICRACLADRRAKVEIPRKEPPKPAPVQGPTFRQFPLPLVFASERIIHRACEIYGLTRKELTSKSRVQVRARARQLCMLAIYEQRRLSMPQIARLLGLSDHTSVVHGITQARNLASRDGEYAWALNELRIAAKGVLDAQG